MKKYNIATFLFFGLASIIMTYYYPYLNQHIGLDIVQVSKVVAVGSLFSIIAQPYIGYKYSNSNNKRSFVVKYLLTITAVTLTMMMIDARLIFLFAPIYGICVLPMTGTYEIFVESISVAENFQYASIRKWGVIGFAVITLVSGALISTIGFYGIFIVGTVLSLGCCLIVAKTFPQVKTNGKSKKISYKNVLKNKNSLLILFLCFLGMGTYYSIDFAYSSYLVQLTNDTNVANNIFSIVTSFKGFTEFFVYILIVKYIINSNLKKAFLSVFALGAMRMLFFSSGVLPLVLLGDQLNSLVSPLFYTFVYKYLRAVEEDQALVSASFALLSVLIFGLPNFIFPGIVSRIQESFGYSAMYMFCAVVIGITLVIGMFKLPDVKKQGKNSMNEEDLQEAI